MDLTDDERKVVEAMKSLKAVTDEGKKDVDQIAKTAMMPKGKVANIIQNLMNKKLIKRIAREKAAGYFLLEQAMQ